MHKSNVQFLKILPTLIQWMKALDFIISRGQLLFKGSHLILDILSLLVFLEILLLEMRSSIICLCQLICPLFVWEYITYRYLLEGWGTILVWSKLVSRWMRLMIISNHLRKFIVLILKSWTHLEVLIVSLHCIIHLTPFVNVWSESFNNFILSTHVHLAEHLLIFASHFGKLHI
jgi:hypothetical protein